MSKSGTVGKNDVAISVHALSPNDLDVFDFLTEISSASPSNDGIGLKGRLPYSKNLGSIVLLLSINDIHIVLGADMEVSRKPDRGWDGVLSTAALGHKQIEAYKVSHHASENGYHSAFWSKHLSSDFVGAISPWRLADKKLPKLDFLERLVDEAGSLWVSASPSPGATPAKGNIVSSEIRNSGIRRTAAYRLVGQIRMRRRLGTDEQWRVEVIQPACTAQAYLAQARSQAA